jgi:hypothetical protein
MSEEIASVVAFLSAGESPYLTGGTVLVDGGSTIVSAVRPSGGAGTWNVGDLDAIACPASPE